MIHIHQRNIRRLVVTSLLTLFGAGLTASAEPAMHERSEAVEARDVLRAIDEDASPEAAYAAFNEFARTHFGTEADPLIYERFGDVAQLMDAGTWVYASAHSAVVAFETNLPTYSVVSYEDADGQTRHSEAYKRPTYLHVHHLTNLDTDTAYIWSVELEDERGNTTTSAANTFQTESSESFITLAPTNNGSSITIREPGRYLLTGDLQADRTAINIETDQVFLDLGGHTVTYAVEERPQGSNDGSFGIHSAGHSNITLVNGRIVQAPTTDREANAGHSDTTIGFNPIVIRNAADVELAGLEIDYHSPQNTGVMLRNPGDNITVHHNIVRDRGVKIDNRHGSATRTIHFYSGSGDNHAIHHNLIARTRQMGMNLRSSGNIYHNELYIDSWSTNSFGMGVPNGPDNDEENKGHYGNRIFATGFNPIGFGWAGRNLKVHNNFIYMYGLDLQHRWYEDWGDINLLTALRVTNYGGGGQERSNLQYYDNLIILRGIEGADVQGTRFFTDHSIEGLVFYDNIVKTERLDDVPAPNSGAIVAHGTRHADSLPAIYRDSRLISNDVIVQFGEAYAAGHAHHFVDVTFEKIGDRTDFVTFRFGAPNAGHATWGHRIIDGTFLGGAAYDDVLWFNTGWRSGYSVYWTLDLETAPDAQVVIRDADDEIVFDGLADSSGRLSIPLKQADIRSPNWKPDGEGSGAPWNQRRHQEIKATPHHVTVIIDNTEHTADVEMTGGKQLILMGDE